MSALRPTFVLAICLLVAGATPLRVVAGEFVVVSATAAPDYHRPEPGKRTETYIFSAGKHFAGSTRDVGEENLPFMSMATMLATGLAKQSYFPAKDPALADLLIVVHWGATQVFDDPEKQFTQERLNAAGAAYAAATADGGFADPTELNQARQARGAAVSAQEWSIAQNADLLGFTAALAKEQANMVATMDEITMRSELAEERYFVVMMAYDYQVLKKEKKHKLLWVSRMSVRSPGNTFATILPAMVRVAAPSFGLQKDGLTRVQTKVREGNVDVGDLKVVESGVAAPKAKP